MSQPSSNHLAPGREHNRILRLSLSSGDANEDSDVDLVILTAEPDKYLLDKSWVSKFGEPERYQEEDYGKLTSVRVFYASGLEVEFGFVTPDWAKAPIDAGTERVVSGGIKVLYDPHGSIARMLLEIDSTRTQGR